MKTDEQPLTWQRNDPWTRWRPYLTGLLHGIVLTATLTIFTLVQMLTS